jgi:hypothetical protein
LLLIYAVATNVFSVLWNLYVGWGIYHSEVVMRAVHMLPEVIALVVLEVLATRLLADQGAVRYPGTVFAIVAATFHFLRYRRVLTAPFEYQAKAFVEAVILFAIGVTAYWLASRTTQAGTGTERE